MTQLEEELRSAFRAKAGEITPHLPPLELEPELVPEPAAHRGSGWLGTPSHRRWLVPLAAAAAVFAVVAGALTVSGTLAAHRTRLGLPATAPVQTSVPPYYVSLTSVNPMPVRKPQAWPVLTTATVRATSTGAAIASIAPPYPYKDFVNVSAAADDRYFVLAAQEGPFTGPLQDGFFLLRINPTAADPAARATLAALPAAALPYDNQLRSMALSPNGRLLATIETPPGRLFYLRIYNLATGRSRTWTSGYALRQGDGADVPGGNGGLSWRQNSRFLAVPWNANKLRLLNVNARGRSLAQDTKPLAAPPPVSYAGFYNTDITPDGRLLYVAYDTGGTPAGTPMWEILGRFNERTGTLTRINRLTVSGQGQRYRGYNPGAVIGPDDVLWTSYDGSKAIVAEVRPGVPNAGVYSGGHFTPIPWPANIVGAAW